MIKIALTGGIGSGKSTALNFFAKLGFYVQDCDDVVSSIYQNCGDFKSALLDHFGNDILTEEKVDKKKIASRVFNSEDDLQWLNSQLHNRVRQEVQDNYQEDKINMVAVPLLHEAGWYKSFDASVCVWCPDDKRIERLKGRGFTEEQSRERMAAQMPQDEKLERSDYGLINDFDLDCLEAQCEALAEKIIELYKSN